MVNTAAMMDYVFLNMISVMAYGTVQVEMMRFMVALAHVMSLDVVIALSVLTTLGFVTTIRIVTTMLMKSSVMLPAAKMSSGELFMFVLCNFYID